MYVNAWLVKTYSTFRGAYMRKYITPPPALGKKFGQYHFEERMLRVRRKARKSGKDTKRRKREDKG
jgi:hypothetical protein